jgi:signal transduction histidine kinase
MIDSFLRALAVTAVLTVVFTASAFQAGGLDPDRAALTAALLALNTMPLLMVHRNPLVVVLLFSVAYPLWVDAGHPAHMFQSLPTLVALYALGTWPRPLWLRAIGLVAPVWMVAAVLVGWWPGVSLHEIGYVAVMFVLGWALGVVVAERRSHASQLEEKTVALQQARRELADRAVADERARIARELHDVIAHAMSVITVRAGVGAHLVDNRPAEAGEALRVIERTGRQALSEMRRMLAVLRDPDPDAPRAEPQPGLGELPRLVEQVTAAGVTTSVTTAGEARPLPPGLDLAAYRVVQEALTNVVKHAPAARASVTVSYLPDALHLEIHNAGPVPAGPVVPGQGMRGMGERVALYDGQLDAGPRPDGFRVHARFPLETPEAGA